MFQIIPTHPSTSYLFGVAAVLLVGYQITRYLYIDARIRKLGARAPVRRAYAPWGIDIAYTAVSHALNNTAYQMWTAMFDKWGGGPGRYTVEATLGGERLIMTADAENIKAILATQFKDYGKGEQFRKDWHQFLGNGIFTTDGELWHNSRQLIRPQFVKDRLSDIDIFEEHVQVLISKIENGQEFDTMDMMFRFTLDAATHFLLGQSVDSLHDPQTKFADAFGNAQRIQSIIARAGPFNGLVPRKRLGFYDSINTINDFVSTYIDKALELSPAELEAKSNHDSGYTFLHAIAGYTRNRSILRDQLVSILLAGRDTTACTLTWTIYHLSKDPAILAKLRQEIIDTVGLTEKPTYENLKNMKYLQHILNETLRLYPVVPFNVRISLKDTTLPTGGGPSGTDPIGILAGTPIGYSTLVLQRRADLYPGPETGFPAVDKYVPERWENWTPKSWTYVPFNGGPRICIGQQFALTEMGYTLVRLFQRFQSVENRMGDVEPGMHADIVLQPAKEIKVVFH
ncbi:similar to cytochrome P450 alkane hydroxylase [Plenodomus lingam JN3]|uniref:Similar to cytochrome P450 alkane hydroxylase n=2 Tax=Leptosphaeria maculans TaxID=5022 RepID=E4ZWF4_LEPMJ|nr:similar to cytochrome P450 alkane hydroxylase [Plenodomus lingam JN3]CBX95930.1 similar to cytochrome P450 alkane hydroxylase [Plenodomus lingam JN3]